MLLQKESALGFRNGPARRHVIYQTDQEESVPRMDKSMCTPPAIIDYNLPEGVFRLTVRAGIEMTALQMTFVDLIRDHISAKRFVLESVPIAATNGLWKYGVTDGREHRTIQFFDEQVMKEAIDGRLSEDARRKIDDALA